MKRKLIQVGIAIVVTGFFVDLIFPFILDLHPPTWVVILLGIPVGIFLIASLFSLIVALVPGDPTVGESAPQEDKTEE